MLARRRRDRAHVGKILHVDLGIEVPDGESDDESVTGWALADIAGGVVGIEHTGYGDPTLEMLRELSRARWRGRRRTDNVMAHLRFGCARDGELLFDDDEFMYTEDADSVPTELRELFDLVYDDLESDEDEDNQNEDGPDPFAVGLAMVQKFTGISLDGDDADAAEAASYWAGPTQKYPTEP